MPPALRARGHALRPLLSLLAGVGLTGAAVAGLIADRALGADAPPGSPPATSDTAASPAPESAAVTPSNASPSTTAPATTEEAPANPPEEEPAAGGDSEPPAVVLTHTQKVTIGRRGNCHSTVRRRSHKHASHKHASHTRSSHTRSSHKRSCAKKAQPRRQAAALKRKHTKGGDRKTPTANRSPHAHAPAPRAQAPAPHAHTPAPHAQAPAPHAQAPAPHTFAPSPQVVAGRIRPLHPVHLSASFSPAPMRALSFYRIPLFLLPIYRAAASRYDVPWELLAAINEVETNYGNDLAVSSAGAIGWMQFLPVTWERYGVDAVAAGYSDPYNPVDAIFAAARYLSDAGVSRDLHGAIFAYNHSDEYVESVLLRGKLISLYPHTVLATLTHLAEGRLPLAGKHVTWGRPDSGPAAWRPTRSRPLPWSPSGSGPLFGLPAAPFPFAPAHGRELAHSAVAKPKPRARDGARSRRGSRARPRATKLLDLMSAPHTSVVAVQSGRIVRIGRSARHGRYLVLRDVHGNRFTYAGLGASVRRHVHRGERVRRGEVLGQVRVPPGAKRGHLLFAIRPAGDPRRIDPRPVVTSWLELSAALHPPGAEHGSDPLGLHASVVHVAHRANATAASSRSKSSSTSPARAPRKKRMSATRWDRLIQLAADGAPRLVGSAPANANERAR
jgi:soluble lytic murein transglycosylase-like protein/murein DD-endopeptidase MepM/ murein hydrolase activator NlpD